MRELAQVHRRAGERDGRMHGERDRALSGRGCEHLGAVSRDRCAARADRAATRRALRGRSPDRRSSSCGTAITTSSLRRMTSSTSSTGTPGSTASTRSSSEPLGDADDRVAGSAERRADHGSDTSGADDADAQSSVAPHRAPPPMTRRYRRSSIPRAIPRRATRPRPPNGGSGPPMPPSRRQPRRLRTARARHPDR